MKRTIASLFAFTVAFGCNNATSDKAANQPTAASDDSVTYAYTIEHPDNWERGSLTNVSVALQMLKDYETANLEGCAKSFADSVQFQVDGVDAILTRDSLKAMLTNWRAGVKNLEFKMSDWESVISKDKKTEYVSVWYKEISTGNDGKIDSVECMDDIKMKDGKINLFNEKRRRYPAK